MRSEKKFERSVTGKTLCKPLSGRKAINCPCEFCVPIGTGAPDNKKREPTTGLVGRIGVIAGQMLPSFGVIKGFEPVRAVLLPLDAKNAYARAAQIKDTPC